MKNVFCSKEMTYPKLCDFFLLVTNVIYQGVLTTKPLEDREFQFFYICSLLSNAHFIRKQNGSLCSFWAEHDNLTLFLPVLQFVLPWVAFLVTSFVLLSWNTELVQQIKLHPNYNCQYPSINYFEYDSEFLIANFTGYAIFVFAALVIYLATNPRFKRLNMPMNEINDVIAWQLN